MRLGRAEWWRSESGHDGGWRLRLVAVANCGAADRSIGSDSARAAAPASLAGLPRFSNHADVHRCERPALCGQRRSGWAAAHSCTNQWLGCGAVLDSASLRADAVDRRRAPFRVGSIWGKMFRSMTSRPSRQSDLLTANARVCTSRMPCALTAILLPESLAHGCHMLQTWFPSGRSWVCTWRGAWNRGGGGEANWHAL